MIYPIIRIKQISYKKQTICEPCPRRQIPAVAIIVLLLELLTHNLKTKQHLATMHKARAVLRLNIPGRRQLKTLLTIDERG